MKKIYLIFTALFLSVNVWANTFEVNGIYYYIIDNTNNVQVSYSNNDPYEGEIIIPGSVIYDGKTYTVTSVAQAFRAKSGITHVTIPSTVTVIGSYAFSECSDLESVTIPASVTTIGQHAFSYCNSLKSVHIPSASIEASAFESCENLTSVTFANTVTNISSGAFIGCTRLSSITIPNSVIEMGTSVFQGCTGLTSAVIACQKVGSRAFMQCSNLKTIEFKNKNTIFDEYAFGYCTSLTTLSIPCETIGNGAFTGCSGLTSVNIENTVINISGLAFNNCSNLESITIGNSVKNIGGSAFAGCGKLKHVTCLATTPPTKEGSVFSQETLNTAVLRVPEDNVDDYNNTDLWKNFGTIVGLNSIISGEVFSDNNNIGYRVTDAESYYVEVIGNTTKNTSSAYTGIVNIPSTVEYQETEFTVTGIAANAFSNSTITEVTIPNTVTNIGDGAFSNCSELTKITIAASTLPTMGADVFSGVTANNVELVVPSGLKGDYKIAAQWNIFALNTTEDPALSIAEPQAAQPFTQQGSSLIFDNEENIAVYNMSGLCVYKGITQNYSLPESGIYIVVTKSGKYKVAN